MKFTLLFSQLLAVACLAGANPTTDKLYAEIDQNKDGKLTAKEFADHIIGVSFVLFDTNHDHKIDAKEWAAVEKGLEGEKAFAELDIDKNGVLTFKEYSGNPMSREVLIRIFSTIDPNHDGVLTVEEVPANKKK
ncbi:MAG: EF-hand domain-containing protein [Chthoniobacter sp.]